jgi:hypothetical protein
MIMNLENEEFRRSVDKLNLSALVAQIPGNMKTVIPIVIFNRKGTPINFLGGSGFANQYMTSFLSVVGVNYEKRAVTFQLLKPLPNVKGEGGAVSNFCTVRSLVPTNHRVVINLACICGYQVIDESLYNRTFLSEGYGDQAENEVGDKTKGEQGKYKGNKVVMDENSLNIKNTLQSSNNQMKEFKAEEEHNTIKILNKNGTAVISESGNSTINNDFS